ncbi:MAG: lamin tail domain-containing protein [Deltaproteobacteria bacterium]|nr:lamin tail domain-containing protein [Deltaproteobacteria bacterium]
MKSLKLFYLFLLAAGGMAACSGAADAGPEISENGALRVALEYQSETGATYYLREARLTVFGQQQTTIEVGDEALMRCPLDPGDYTLQLEPGWWVEREEQGEFQRIEAELLSPNPASINIVSGEETDFTLRFLVAGEPIAFEPGELVIRMEVEVADGGLQLADATNSAQHLVINEVDYEQPGTDNSEFVEIFNPTGSAVPTDGLVLELINGADGKAQVYARAELAAAGEAIPAFGYLVVASETVSQMLSEEVLFLLLPKSIQNGNPDGLRLMDNDTVLDSVSYGGIIEGVTEGDSAPIDKAEESIARCHNGMDSDDNALDFRSALPATPGAENSCGYEP